MNIRMLTIKEAAKEYGLAVHAVRQFVNSGKLAAKKCGKKFLIASNNLEQFLLEGDNQPPPLEFWQGKIKRLD